MVKADDFLGLPFLKVTTHCITNLARPLGNRVYFGKNGFPEGARDALPSGASSTMKINSFIIVVQE
jgi:hypothetical protein